MVLRAKRMNKQSFFDTHVTWVVVNKEKKNTIRIEPRLGNFFTEINHARLAIGIINGIYTIFEL